MFLSFRKDVAVWLRADRHHHGAMQGAHLFPGEQEEGGVPATGVVQQGEGEPERGALHHPPDAGEGGLQQGQL